MSDNKNGLIVFDKPKGITSQDAVSFIKKIFNLKKVGHLGTLDPFATGVLPILTEKFTKLAPYFTNINKVYEAEILFGKATNTKDITGDEVSFRETFNKEELLSTEVPTDDEVKKNLEEINDEKIKKVLKKFIGDITQYVPSFSAIKRDGIRLYDLARRNLEVPIVKKEVRIDDINFLDFNKETLILKIEVKCTSGTYIRSLGEDIGKALGVPSLTNNLRRTYSNGFIADESFDFDTLAEQANKGVSVNKFFAHINKGLEDFFELEITKRDKESFKIGKEFEVTYCPDNEKILVYNEDELIGVAKCENKILYPIKVFI